jgi:DNA-binding winged helix-turn-helix (wHTH) protein
MILFRGFEFDVAARRLCRGSHEIHVTPKAFELLALLIERRPHAVAKGEIHDRLWPGTFVAEITLHSLVSELRHALGDRAGKPRIIRTKHGYGYAFISPVEESDRPSPSAPRRLWGWLIGESARLSLFEGDNVLGRGVDDVIEVASSTVSRRHASIRLNEEEAWLEDLGSKNGTFVNDANVTGRVKLAEGDRVRLGSARFTFRLSRHSGAATTQDGGSSGAFRTPDLPR